MAKTRYTKDETLRYNLLFFKNSNIKDQIVYLALKNFVLEFLNSN